MMAGSIYPRLVMQCGPTAAALFILFIFGPCSTAVNAQVDGVARLLSSTMEASGKLLSAPPAKRDTSKAASSQKFGTSARPASGKRTSSATRSMQTTQADRSPQEPAVQPYDPGTPSQLSQQFPITATDFTPVTLPTMPDTFANSATNISSKDREELRSMFWQTLTTYEKQVRPHNLANAFAFICAASMKVKNGNNPNKEEIERMVTDFNDRLAVSPGFQAYSPSQKQNLYEALVLIGGLIIYADVKGQETKNKQMRQQASTVATQVLKNFLGES